mgnify:CR=1 FL=1
MLETEGENVWLKMIMLLEWPTNGWAKRSLVFLISGLFAHLIGIVMPSHQVLPQLHVILFLPFHSQFNASLLYPPLYIY